MLFATGCSKLFTLPLLELNMTYRRTILVGGGLIFVVILVSSLTFYLSIGTCRVLVKIKWNLLCVLRIHQVVVATVIKSYLWKFPVADINLIIPA